MAGVALGAGDLISHVVTLAVAACAAILVQHFVVGAARKAIDGSNLPSATIFINLLRALVWAFALLAVLKPVFGVEPTAFITALGVTSLVVSLGLQDTISNLVGGLGLMTARVVKPGDQVGVGSVTGEVVDVTWRSTLVRSRGGSVDLIPNSVLNKTGLTRRTRWQVTCADLPFAVASGNDLDRVAQDIRDAAARELAGLLEPVFEVEVVFTEFTPRAALGVVHLHVKDDVVPSHAVDRLARAIANCPWMAYTQGDSLA
ncbi:mechanosensitive ion channel family protein [Olsenella urininfantis]|uniref:mechanosensitive ion channel family protein n=1 Tax=Olsenella urininfantis TaxID=1871033 RepID=UPI0009850A04|nr:mechanosensitive ion channel domain-containing protein [Olsenella urininfantis]